MRKNTVGRGLLLLLVSGLVGYGIGLGLEMLVTGVLKFSVQTPDLGEAADELVTPARA